MRAAIPLAHWVKAYRDVDLPASTYDRLLRDLAATSCTCDPPHPPDHHALEVFRLIETGTALQLRLGACEVADCRCQGGRP